MDLVLIPQKAGQQVGRDCEGARRSDRQHDQEPLEFVDEEEAAGDACGVRSHDEGTAGQEEPSLSIAAEC